MIYVVQIADRLTWCPCFRDVLKKYSTILCTGELTLIVASASVDVVTAISLFGVFLGLAFSEGTENLLLLVKAKSEKRKECHLL